MKNFRSASFALLALGFGVLQSAFGQVAAGQVQGVAPKADLSVEARLVVVPTVVRDKHGALMNGLTKDDFLLQVDGKPQAVRYFDHDSDVPLTLGLLVDTSMSQRSVLGDERTASAAFLEKMLAPERDKAFVIQFARTVELLQDVTASKPKLQAALQQLDASASQPSFSRQGDASSGPSDGGGYGRQRGGGGGTMLYDSVFLAADEVMAKEQGRRALILLTDGDDRGSKVSLARAIEVAQRANTMVYAIYYKGERPSDHGGGPGGGHGGFPGGGGRGGGHPLVSEFGQMGGGRGGGGGYGRDQVDGKKILERMCGETGGRVFEVKKKETLEVIYGEIAEELRTQYRLGFTPSLDARADGYHKVLVQMTGAAVKAKPVVQTRDGYYVGQ